MHLKSTPIFLVIAVISLSLISNVYAYSDAEITNMYRGQDDNQTLDNIDLALHSGSLHCSDLPSNLIMGFCQNQTQTSTPQPQQTSSTPASSNSGLVLIPLLMIVSVALILIMKIITGGGSIHMPRIFMKTKSKSKDIKNTKWTDGFGHTHSIAEKQGGTYPKGFHIEQTEEPRPNPITNRHKFLLSLGLMKVKKK